jgi:hypothetical protein
MGVEFHGNGPLDKCLIDLSLWIVARDVSRGFAPIVREPKGLPQGPFGPPPAVLRTLDPNPWVHESETINLQNINITLTVALVLVSANIRKIYGKRLSGSCSWLAPPHHRLRLYTAGQRSGD